MTQEAKPGIKEPENLDLKKLKQVADKLVQDNKAWLKEMADK